MKAHDGIDDSSLSFKYRFSFFLFFFFHFSVDPLGRRAKGRERGREGETGARLFLMR